MESSDKNFRICDLALAWAQTQTALPSLDVRSYDSTASTNLLAKENSFFGKERILFLAHHQSAGRGRGQNQWHDSKGQQLLSSWSFHLQRPPQPVFPILVGLCLFQSCRRIWPMLPWALKAPNDLLLADRKIAGLLVETVSQNGYQIVIGLGMNFRGEPDSEMSKILQPIISLSELRPFDPLEFEKFLSSFYSQLWDLVEKNPASLNSEECRDLLQALNANHRLSEPYQSIDEHGSLSTSTKLIHWSEI